MSATSHWRLDRSKERELVELAHEVVALADESIVHRTVRNVFELAVRGLKWGVVLAIAMVVALKIAYDAAPAIMHIRDTQHAITCVDFATQHDAQITFDNIARVETIPDPLGLDIDGDGKACEGLPVEH